MKNGENLIHSFEGPSEVNFNGLTKREYFAGLAMQGLLANSNIDLVCASEEIKAKWSIKQADELLKQLEQ